MKHYNITAAFTDGEDKTWYDVTAPEIVGIGVQFRDDNKGISVLSTHLKYTEIEVWEDDEPEETPETTP